MNQFHRPIEKTIEPWLSKLLLIPTISGLPYYHSSWKIKSILLENKEQDHTS